ncbi:MAG: hypothetical protein KGZ59_02625 [Chitinophagaceae bacterium]|nr:hypothetical protein [Chitinophagaceae bacterium]
MSFSTTKLPTFLITDLFKKVLISSTNNNLPAPENMEFEEIRKPLEFLGENKKGIAIVINDANAVYITDDKLQLLTNLLLACNLSIADVAIINIANKNINFTTLKTSLNIEYLLMMGIDIQAFELPLIFSKNKVQHFDKISLLITENLSVLIGNSNEVKNEKRALWNALKLMFNIK